MIFAEIAAFFFAVCTPSDNRDPSQECLRWLHECWVYEMQQGKHPDPFFHAEVCSELLPPELVE